MHTRYLLRVAYNGTAFSGSARQACASPRPTVQGSLESVVRRLRPNAAVSSVLASRTDAGVSALENLVQVDVKHETRASQLSSETLYGGLNALLSDLPLAVTSVHTLPTDADLREYIEGKTYEYRIAFPRPSSSGAAQTHVQVGALAHPHAWVLRSPPDLERMYACAQVLCGTHDFSSFRAAGCGAKSPIRTVHRIDVVSDTHAHPLTTGDVPAWHAAWATAIIRVRGESFLYRMVRNLVGTLVTAGHRAWSPSDVSRVLAAAHRRYAHNTAPPHALTLREVHTRGMPLLESFPVGLTRHPLALWATEGD